MKKVSISIDKLESSCYNLSEVVFVTIDAMMETLARAFSYILPIVGVIALVYLILFLKQLIETLKQVSKTLDTANDQLKKLDAPLKTAENISNTVDEVNQTARDAFMNVVGAVSENVQNAKDWIQVKKAGKESLEKKEDE